MIHARGRVRPAVGTKWSRQIRVRINPDVVIGKCARRDSLTGAQSAAGSRRNFVNWSTARAASDWPIGVVDEDRRFPGEHIVGVLR